MQRFQGGRGDWLRQASHNASGRLWAVVLQSVLWSSGLVEEHAAATAATAGWLRRSQSGQAAEVEWHPSSGGGRPWKRPELGGEGGLMERMLPFWRAAGRGQDPAVRHGRARLPVFNTPDSLVGN